MTRFLVLLLVMLVTLFLLSLLKGSSSSSNNGEYSGYDRLDNSDYGLDKHCVDDPSAACYSGCRWCCLRERASNGTFLSVSDYEWSGGGLLLFSG